MTAVLTALFTVYVGGLICLLIAVSQRDGEPRGWWEAVGMILCCVAWPYLAFVWGVSEFHNRVTRPEE